MSDKQLNVHIKIRKVKDVSLHLFTTGNITRHSFAA